MGKKNEKYEEEIERGDPKQCRVCKEKFPTAVDMNLHFRSHGMEFLRQKKS